MKDLVIEKIPKTELHIHIEGTLEPNLMFHLAHKNKIELPFKTIEEVKNAYNFHNLQSFLDIYYQGTKVLINEEDFFALTYNYLEKAAAQNIIHTEIFFDPQSHTARGIPFATIINGIDQALEKGRKELNISSYLIMCFLRHLEEDSALKTLNQALLFQDKIMGIGLDSSELGNPPSKFKNVFKKAKEAGFLTVAHAGEEGPPEYIWEAINILGVSRIDHGVRCLEDGNLIKYLQETQIPLTVCPLSNVKLRVFNTMKEHNLKTLLDLGLCVTVNSDDPAYFGGYLLDNFLAVKDALNLTNNDLKKLVENGFKASFLPKN